MMQADTSSFIEKDSSVHQHNTIYHKSRGGLVYEGWSTPDGIV